MASILACATTPSNPVRRLVSAQSGTAERDARELPAELTPSFRKILPRW